MSQDLRKNNDLFPDLDFSEPDWLRDEAVFFTKETPAPSAPEPVRPSPTAVPDSFWDPPQPQKAPVTARHPSEKLSQKQPRSDRRSHTNLSNRHPPAAPSKKRRRRHSSRNVLVILLILLLIGGMIFAGWQLGSIFLDYKRDRSAYDELATSALIQLAEPEDDRTVSHTPSSLPAELEEEIVVVEEKAPATEIPFTVDWDYLSSVNPDIVGWLYCPDTIINYPVVQSEDHDYYLNHGFEGQTNSSGTLFADRDSVAGITQSHLIIYGHNMKDSSMFGTLKHYVDEDYFEEHPIFYYLTPEGCYRVELICSMVVEAVTSNFPVYFSSTNDYQNYLDRITSGAYWVNSDAVSSSNQLMTFSTCTYGGGYTDPRLLVHGMMIPIE